MKKLISLLFLLFLLLLIPAFLHSHDYVVYGATSPTAINGNYTSAGAIEGKPYYKHDTEEYYIRWYGGWSAWIIVSFAGLGDPPAAYTFFRRIDPAIVGAYENYLGAGTVFVEAYAEAGVVSRVIMISE